MKWKPLVIFQTSLRYYVKGGLFFLTGSEFSGMADACFFNFPLSKWEKLMLAHNNKRSRSKMNTFLPSQRFNDKLKLVQCSFSLWLCNILSYISYESMLLNNKCKFDYVFCVNVSVISEEQVVIAPLLHARHYVRVSKGLGDDHY